MARTIKSFDRPAARYKEQPKVLVICEDTKSGKNYLEDACYYFRVGAEVSVIHCGKTDPLNIVNEARNRQKAFDKVYCVIDRDTHEHFEDALNLAKSPENIEIIASYPCFEYWLLLHFSDSRKPYVASGKNSAGEMLIKDLRKHDGMEKYNKGDDLGVFNNLLGSRFDSARRISPKILADALNSGDMNPSTKLHVLIDFFEKLSAPQKL